MSDFADYPIHEGYGVSIFAQVEYGIEPASGDGWNEPREEAHAYVIGATLYRVERKAKYRWDAATYRHVLDGHTDIRTELGDAPEWVFDILNADDDWLSELVAAEMEAA